MECKYCGTILKSKYSLETHQRTAKYCLIQQKKLKEYKCICKFCNKVFKNEDDLSFHIITCDIKKNQDDHLTLIEEHCGKISQLEKEKHYLYQKLRDYEEKIICLEKDNNILRKEVEPLHRKKVARIFWQEYNKQPNII